MQAQRREYGIIFRFFFVWRLFGPLSQAAKKKRRQNAGATGKVEGR
jgi:hypothetical protein